MVKEKILVTGASGMVGSRFVDTYIHQEDLLTPDLDEFQLTSESIASYFSSHPDIGAVINFAAYTNVSEAQKQKGDQVSLCHQINVVGTENLVNQVKGKDIYLIHISTDMVFPGDSSDPGPYAEDHELTLDPNRLSWYGYTKALAEQSVKDSLPNAAILRLIYPVVAKYDLKPDYLRAPLAYYEKDKTLYPIFSDQKVNITDVDEICQAINVLLNQRLSGVFHTGSSDITTPYEIMTQLFDLVYGNHDMVKPGSLVEFLKTQSDPTRYPQFGGLLNQETARKLAVNFSTSSEIITHLYGNLRK